MASPKSTFPHFLPAPDPAQLEWLGARLRSLTKATDKVELYQNKIEEIESGQFHLNLGQLRDILRTVYRVDLETVLAELFKKFYSNDEKDRPFERDFHYSLRHKDHADKATRLFVGGDHQKYLWAVPLRRLKNQNLSTDFLELAPQRKKQPSGITPQTTHSGVEVITIIHGSVEVYHRFPQGELYKRLGPGEAMHLHSEYPHRIENREKNLCALLLFVRSPERLAPKSSRNKSANRKRSK